MHFLVLLTSSWFWVGTPEPASRPGVHHLDLLGLDVLQHIFVALHPGLVQARLEVCLLRLGVVGGHRVTVSHPVLKASVQHRHRAVSEHPEHPPHSGRAERAEVAGVVDDDVGVVPDAEVTDIPGEVAGSRQHVVVLGALIAAFIYVEKRRSRYVFLVKLLSGVPLAFR